jgi:hypothetical protein
VLAATGANCLYTNVSSVSDDKIQEARDRSLYLILEENGVSESALAAALASDPILLGTYIFDDMDNGSHTVQDIIDKIARRQSDFPDKLTYGSCGTLNSETYMGYCDLDAFQAYSFAGNGDVEGGYDDLMKHMGTVVSNGTLDFWVLNLQLYSDGVNGYPDASGLRAMLYQSIIQGAVGCIAYSGWGGGGTEDAVNMPSLMNEMTALYTELEALKEYIMLGQRTVFAPHPVIGEAATFETSDGILAIFHNSSDEGNLNNGLPLSITIPTGLTNKRKAFARYADDFTYNSGTGQFSGTLDDEEVQVFLLDK